MVIHKKVYLKHVPDNHVCEFCYAPATDIHHIYCKGMGGSKSKDVIENLMALCRSCHVEYGDKTRYYDSLIEAHRKFLEDRGVIFSEEALESAKKR